MTDAGEGTVRVGEVERPAMRWVDPPTLGSLYSGIGGWDLGFTLAGWQVRWQCERNPYRQQVLKRHWPDGTMLFGDGTAPWPTPAVDCLVAACPTQEFSDQSMLHEAVWQRIREAQPVWAVVETTHHAVQDLRYAERQLEAAGYESAVVPAVYGSAACGLAVNWLRLLVVARRRSAPGTDGAWRALDSSALSWWERNEAPEVPLGIRYGPVTVSGDDKPSALGLASSLGFPPDWLLDGPGREVTSAVVDTTAVPVAIELARLLARPEWQHAREGEHG